MARGESDYGPLLVVGVLGIAGAALVFLTSRSKAAPVTDTSGAGDGSTPPGTGTGPRPPGGRPPSASPPGQAPPPDPKLSPDPASSSSFHPSPLYLWILQDGTTEWVGIGWFYGHDDQVGRTDPSSGYHLVPVWRTPEGEIKIVLDSLRDEGIAGYFDTIEPTGVEDRNFEGRIDQAYESKGVWFWVPATESEDAHYVQENAYYVQEVIG